MDEKYDVCSVIIVVRMPYIFEPASKVNNCCEIMSTIVYNLC